MDSFILASLCRGDSVGVLFLIVPKIDAANLQYNILPVKDVNFTPVDVKSKIKNFLCVFFVFLVCFVVNSCI